MGESFARAENFRRWKRKRGAKRYERDVRLRPAREVDKVLWVTDDWSKGYFHWLADVLPKLVIGAGHLEDSVLLLPARFRGSDLVKDSLGLFGVDNFEFLTDREAVTARRLHLPVHMPRSGEFDPAAIREVRRTLVNAAGTTQTLGRRVYISRERAKRRKVVNEDEVLSVLAEFGFEKVFAEEMPFTGQIALFSAASRIVSIHGAGLANMLFMPEGGGVMEFRKNDPRADECFSNMAAALGHKFYCRPCRAVDEEQAPYTADLIVDAQTLRSGLRQFLDE